MKAAYLDDASPAEVSHSVLAVLEGKGALVSEHSHARIVFRGTPPLATPAWLREGYVGVYQNVGERDVALRLKLRARWPYRTLWTIAFINVLVAIVIAVLNPNGTTWFLAAAIMGFLLLVAGIVYMNTWNHVLAEEEALMAAFEARIQLDHEGLHIMDEDARELARMEAELEGELERRRMARDRKASGESTRPRLSLRPFRKAPPAAEISDEEVDAKRAHLAARKAELEARRREQE